MEKERKIKIFSVVALIVAVLGLTVAFAALSQTLTINGTASVDAASWNIHFKEEEVYFEGTLSDPLITGTSIVFDSKIKKPNDQVVVVAPITNEGTINAKVSSVEISEVCTLSSPIESCDWDNDGKVTQADIDKFNENISFIVLNEETTSEIKVGDTLNVGETKNVLVMVVYAKFDPNSEELLIEATESPKRDLVLEDLSVTINYVQAD